MGWDRRHQTNADLSATVDVQANGSEENANESCAAWTGVSAAATCTDEIRTASEGYVAIASVTQLGVAIAHGCPASQSATVLSKV